MESDRGSREKGEELVGEEASNDNVRLITVGGDVVLTTQCLSKSDYFWEGKEQSRFNVLQGARGRAPATHGRNHIQSRSRRLLSPTILKTIFLWSFVQLYNRGRGRAINKSKPIP